MNKITFEILKVGGHGRFVNTGRHHKMLYGYPYGGPMNQEFHNLANRILGNTPDLSTIESSLIPTTVKFHSKEQIVLTGANHEWTLDNLPLAQNKSISVKPGQTLRGKPSRNYLRSYIGIQGLNIPNILSSALEKKKYLFERSNILAENPELELNHEDLKFPHEFPIKFGPEHYLLNQESKLKLLSYPFVLSSNMDRSGAQLIGESLSMKCEINPNSVVNFPGVIQLLPNGQLIVLLNDAQITGGYPRIAFIPPNVLNSFNNLLPSGKGTLIFK